MRSLSNRPKKLKRQQLNRLFIEGLGDVVREHNGFDATPLLVDLKQPFPLKLRVYLFNCTNPPGGRALDEYKIQVILPGQSRGTRASLDYSDGRMPLLAAYARFADEVKDGVFVFWDSYKHRDFSYSANMQVKSDAIIKALCAPFSTSKRSNDEVVIVARPPYLLAAIRHRIELLRKDIEGGLI